VERLRFTEAMTRREWAWALGVVVVFTVALVIALALSYPPEMGVD
jgi:hypothetical protein